jgi:hypothetical protein
MAETRRSVPTVPNNVGKLGTWLQRDSSMAAIVISQIAIQPGLNDGNLQSYFI